MAPGWSAQETGFPFHSHEHLLVLPCRITMRVYRALVFCLRASPVHQQNCIKHRRPPQYFPRRNDISKAPTDRRDVYRVTYALAACVDLYLCTKMGYMYCKPVKASEPHTVRIDPIRSRLRPRRIKLKLDYDEIRELHCHSAESRASRQSIRRNASTLPTPPLHILKPPSVA